MRPAIERRNLTGTMGLVALTGGTLMVLFWVLYFSAVIVFPDHEGVVGGYESAFVLADLFLTLLLVAAGWGLLTRQSWGVFCFVMASSIAVYLGLLDFAFYMNQGLYDSLSPAALVEIVVNLLCVGGGGLGLLMSWRAWGQS